MSDPGIDSDTIETLKNLKIKYDAEMTLKIVAEAKTISDSMKMTATVSGKNIDTVWSFIKTMFSGDTDPDDPVQKVTFNEKNHSITIEQEQEEPSVIPDEMIEEMLKSIQINQTGKKIKRLGEKSGERNEPDLILNKA